MLVRALAVAYAGTFLMLWLPLRLVDVATMTAAEVYLRFAAVFGVVGLGMYALVARDHAVDVERRVALGAGAVGLVSVLATSGTSEPILRSAQAIVLTSFLFAAVLAVGATLHALAWVAALIGRRLSR